MRAGYSIHAVDLFGDVDLRRICTVTQVTDYPAGLIAAVAADHDGSWIYTGGLENHPALIDRWAKLRQLWGNTGDVLRRVRDPAEVIAALRSSGLSCPQVALDNPSAGDGEWLLKSRQSSGGAHVSRWPSGGAGKSLPREYYLQQFVPGRACSAVYVAARGRAVLLGITRQLVGAPWTRSQPFQYCGSVGPLLVAPTIEAHFARVGEVLAREFDLVGLFGVDAILNGNRVWPVEINPRYTASVEVLERAYGFHAIEFHAAACSAGVLPIDRHETSAGQYGKAILFAKGRLVVPANLCSHTDCPAASSWPVYADIPAAGSVIEAGWPILTILAAERTERDVVDSLRRQVATIESELA